MIDQTLVVIGKIKSWMTLLDYLHILDCVDAGYYQDYANYEEENFYRIFGQWLIPFPNLEMKLKNYFYDE